jgi:dTDP-4-dehydrorhamnose reductase
VGAAGQLGSELVRALRRMDVDVLPLTRSDVDLEAPATLASMLSWRPEVVINSAAWTDVDGCARDPARAMRVNGAGAGAVAAAAADLGALAVQISTNEVFDGTLERPYREDDATNPINPYGASKLAGEQAVIDASARHLIVRTAWLFGPGHRTFPSKIRTAAAAALAAGTPLRVVADEYGNPTWVPDLAAGIARAVDLALGGAAPPILHLAGWPAASRLDWARLALPDLRDLVIEPMSQVDFPRPSRVPLRAVLDVTLGADVGIEPSDWRAATAGLITGSGVG